MGIIGVSLQQFVGGIKWGSSWQMLGIPPICSIFVCETTMNQPWLFGHPFFRHSQLGVEPKDCKFNGTIYEKPMNSWKMQNPCIFPEEVDVFHLMFSLERLVCWKYESYNPHVLGFASLQYPMKHLKDHLLGKRINLIQTFKNDMTVGGPRKSLINKQGRFSWTIHSLAHQSFCPVFCPKNQPTNPKLILKKHDHPKYIPVYHTAPDYTYPQFTFTLHTSHHAEQIVPSHALARAAVSRPEFGNFSGQVIVGWGKCPEEFLKVCSKDILHPHAEEYNQKLTG